MQSFHISYGCWGCLKSVLYWQTIKLIQIISCNTGTVDIWHLFRHAQASAFNALSRNPPNKGKETRALAHVLCLFHLKKEF